MFSLLAVFGARRWKKRLTTSNQNELSFKYDIFKVIYTSISEQFSKHIIKTLNQRLSQINSLSSSIYELNEIRCANILTWLGFTVVFASSFTALYLCKEIFLLFLFWCFSAWEKENNNNNKNNLIWINKKYTVGSSGRTKLPSKAQTL